MLHTCYKKKKEEAKKKRKKKRLAFNHQQCSQQLEEASAYPVCTPSGLMSLPVPTCLPLGGTDTETSDNAARETCRLIGRHFANMGNNAVKMLQKNKIDKQ